MKGHIRQRGANTWAIVLDARGEDGKRRRRWHSFKGTKREAQVECARLIAEAQSGGAVDPTRVTVAAFLDRFLEDWAPLHLTAGSTKRYREALVHVCRHLGDRRLQTVRPVDISGLYAALVRQGLNPKTVGLVHSVLHRALGQAKIWAVIATNPTDAVRPPKTADRETECLQPAQACELLRKLHGHPLYLVASLALSSGMRRNEMLALRWSDIDLDGAKLTVATAFEGSHARTTKSPKTKSGRRTISLPASMIDELRIHRRAQQERRLAAGMGRVPADAYVFSDDTGRALGPNAITCAWPRAMRAIGMPEVNLHSLRHTHASMLIASGMDVLTISRRLGHSTPTVTLKVYGHLFAGADDKAAAVMEAAFGKKG